MHGMENVKFESYVRSFRARLGAGRSWVWFPIVSLEILIVIILQAALWPWGWLSL